MYIYIYLHFCENKINILKIYVDLDWSENIKPKDSGRRFLNGNSIK